MLLANKGKYYEDSDILYSAIYGRNFYKCTDRMVQDPLAGDEGRGNVSPLLVNIETNEMFFMKRVNESYEVMEKYIQKIKNPPNREDILWPCDLIKLETADQVECELAVDQVYSYSHERTAKYDNLVALFPYGGYPVCENGSRYLSHIGELSWKNPKIRNMVMQIATCVKNLNQYGYLYLDFHFSRMFFYENGKIYLNFTNLLFFDSAYKTVENVGYFNEENCTYPIEFAEPAFVQGKQELFDYRSQNYSMTAMFFYLMFGRYAYDGKLMDGYMDDTEREHYEKFRDYHKMPVFIFDPKDDSNALGTFADEQQILDLWEETPGEIKTLFLHTLCQENAERTGKDRTASPEDWLKCFEKLGWYAAKKENSVTEEETADEGQ